MAQTLTVVGLQMLLVTEVVANVEANVSKGSWGCAEEVQVAKVEDEAEHGRNCTRRTFRVWAWVRSRLENRLDITVQLKRAMARQHLQFRDDHDGEFWQYWLADIPLHQSIPFHLVASFNSWLYQG